MKLHPAMYEEEQDSAQAITLDAMVHMLRTNGVHLESNLAKRVLLDGMAIRRDDQTAWVSTPAIANEDYSRLRTDPSPKGGVMVAIDRFAADIEVAPLPSGNSRLMDLFAADLAPSAAATAATPIARASKKTLLDQFADLETAR